MTCNCLKPNQSQKFDKFCWSVKITQNITKHQNMIKIADSVEVFFFIHQLVCYLATLLN